MGARLMAVVAEGDRERVYLSPKRGDGGRRASSASRSGSQRLRLPRTRARFWTPPYGLTTYGDLFTPRQLVALTTFSDMVQETRELVKRDAITFGLLDDGKQLHWRRWRHGIRGRRGDISGSGDESLCGQKQLITNLG